MAKEVDPETLIGQSFSRLTVVEFAGKSTNYARLYKCECVCGGVSIVTRQDLLSGHTRSCGCIHRETSPKNRTKHGDTIRGASPEHRAWFSAKERCTDPTHPAYLNYGGRGISMCREWLDDFPSFLAYVGRRPSCEHSLGRKDNDGNYEPGNVEWQTLKVQSLNRRTNVRLERGEESKTLSEWAAELGISRSAMSSRVKRNGLDHPNNFKPARLGNYRRT